MANRLKEDERNEKVIRGLLKLPANRRCINCNSLGPQYVCTNFWTFVCTTCSGIHREYTHRVKSVSMAKFTTQEVSALQGGGNERAREVYLKEWDPQRHSVPDSSNVERLRDFIRHVYVDRRYTGERSVDKPPRVKMGEKEDSYENKRVDTSRGGSRTPPYDDTYDRRYGERSGFGGRNDERTHKYNYDERRSPGYDQESRYGNNYRKSPVRFEVVDDRIRDDRFGNGRKLEDRSFPDGESKSEGRSPNRQMDVFSPPMVRPVRDILGEDVPPLRVGEPPKANGGKASDGLARTQRTVSSSSLGSNNGGSVELKRANSGTLIDFNADPEPSAATAVSPAQPMAVPVVQPVTQPIGPSVDGGNWASFDFAPPAPAQPQAPSSANTLEDLLSQLSAPATAPVGSPSVLPTSAGIHTTLPVGNMTTLPVSSGSPVAITNSSALPFSGVTAAPLGNVPSSPISGGVSAAAPGDMMSTMPFAGGSSSTKTNDGGLWPTMHQNNPSVFTANNSQSYAPQFNPVTQTSNNQTWNSSIAENVQLPSTPYTQPSQAASKENQEASSVVATLPVNSEGKAGERKALPEDLFTAMYSVVPVSVPAWRSGPSSGMGFGMQYPTAAQMQTFPQSKPTNPFDLSTEPTMVHATSFPSMASVQGVLPNMGAPPGLVRTTSLGNPSQQWMPQSQSYASSMQAPPYVSTMPSSPYMGQQFSTNIPALGNQGSGSLGEAAFFGNLSTDQQQPGRYSLPATPNSFSSAGGNPFG
ncbi:hypothetical protein IFM89_035214 [Coptis chinensis]|uniref:Arf-GAP domain-containing protein n=1 Tax=Coptis chinensis TaxID=261450 RepID=A0A835IE55_9MAGN|nr:hypothetical protein IFM89_035214 [Coptis chinensis]